TGNIRGAANNLRPGIIRTIMVGTNLNIFVSKNVDVGFTYYYNNALTTIERKMSRESVLPSNLYTRESKEQSLSYPQTHFLFGSIKYKIDPTQKLNFRFRINYQTGGSLRDKEDSTMGSNDTLENEVSQRYELSQNRFSIAPSLNYQKEFKKKGRELAVNVVADLMVNENKSENNSRTNLYNDNGVLALIDTLGQEQYQNGSSQNYRADITFREPIGEDNKLYFKLLAGIKIDQNEQDAYDISGQQRIRNTDFTNAYWRHYNYQEFNITFKRKVDAYSLSVGLGIKRSALEGVVASSIDPIVQDFYFPTGNLRFRYFISKSKKITLTYRTRFSEPRLQQLQPVVNNQDPLSLVKGNPGLQPEYHHNIRLRLDWWEQLTFTNFYTSLSLNLTQNTIIQSQTFDANLRVTYKPINEGLTYRAGVYLGCNTILKKLQMKVDVRGGVSLNQRPLLLNGALTQQLNHDYNANLTLSNKKKKIIDVLTTARLVIGNAIYANDRDLNVSYINHNYATKIRVTIAKKWNLSTNFECKIYANTGFGETIVVPIWTARINRTFLENNALKIELMGQNLLNQNLQVNQYNQDGIISETQSVLLGRYIMLKIQYKIKS
ncbi:MAG: outer membrane beta-barrel protein, partial [Aureispira sp.]|nr:outer membrane beta-barrel protein [Aureispira sp.]